MEPFPQQFFILKKALFPPQPLLWEESSFGTPFVRGDAGRHVSPDIILNPPLSHARY